MLTLLKFRNRANINLFFLVTFGDGMYKKITFFVLPLLTALLFVINQGNAGGDRSTYHYPTSIQAKQGIEHSFSKDGRTDRDTKYAIRVKAKHNTAMISIGLPWISFNEKVIYSTTISTFRSHFFPDNHIAFVTSRGPPAC